MIIQVKQGVEGTVMNDGSGQSRPNEGVDFESAFTSTPEVSLQRGK
jgi:hypothetical protein